MHWKMSIELTYPLVPAMGQHDPLDGMITYHQLQATATALSGELRSDLKPQIGDMADICEDLHLTTADPLGIGAVLSNALKVARLRLLDRFRETGLIEDLLTAAKRGLDDFSGRRELKLPSEYRLAFRELGLAIGLHAVTRLTGLAEAHPETLAGVRSPLSAIDPYTDLRTAIETFWASPSNQQCQTWTEHRDINGVMLATSLLPDGYLGP